MNRLDRSDIQGNILQGYGLPYAEHWFAQIHDARAARVLLGELREQIETATPWAGGQKPASTLNLGLSYAGLEALEIAAPILAKLPIAFREGMVRRAALLGDDAEEMHPVWSSGRVHLWFSLYAQSAEALSERAAFLRAQCGSRIELLEYADRGQRLPGGIEHFGFPDGISNPRVDDGSGTAAGAGDGVRSRDGQFRPYAAGEFLLGHRDEAGELAGESLPRRLVDNGTFVVYRKLEQDVLGFRRYVREAAQRLGQSPEFIAAKLVGRWQNGEPLATRAQGVANDVSEDQNSFGYASDRDGAGCPLGAHIRRANPRDATGFSLLTDRHRMLRRGLPYGPLLPPDIDPDRHIDPHARERGLLFVAMNASIERQFEFVQRHWLNDGAISRQSRDRDPVCGSHLGPAKLVIQADPRTGRVPLVCTELPRFVTTRGGEYFFMPSLRALFALAQNSFADIRSPLSTAAAANVLGGT